MTIKSLSHSSLTDNLFYRSMLAGNTAHDPGPTPPAVLSNAKVWLDAADATTITESGGAVSQWNNKGTLGNFTQATSALQPTTGTQTINGRNVLDFNGDTLVSSDAASSFQFMNDGTTFLIATVIDYGPAADSYNSTIATLDGSSSNTGFILSNDNRTSIGRTNRLAIIVFGSANPGNVSVLLENDNYYSAGDFIFSSIIDPDNGTVANRALYWTNATAGTVFNSRTGGVNAAAPLFTMEIGNKYYGGYSLQAQIGEIIILSGSDATEANRSDIVNYLNSKWAIY